MVLLQDGEWHRVKLGTFTVLPVEFALAQPDRPRLGECFRFVVDEEETGFDPPTVIGPVSAIQAIQTHT